MASAVCAPGLGFEEHSCVTLAQLYWEKLLLSCKKVYKLKPLKIGKLKTEKWNWFAVNCNSRAHEKNSHMKRSKTLWGIIERWKMTAAGLKICLFYGAMGADASLCHTLASRDLPVHVAEVVCMLLICPGWVLLDSRCCALFKPRMCLLPSLYSW